MRIGLMLRAFSEKGGVGVYTRNITRHLVETDKNNEYFLYYSSAEFKGTFAGRPNVTERVVSVGSKILWDQLAMPYWFRKDKLDAIFHPKFTVPLLCGSRSVMVLHGAGWFIPETRRFWSLATRIYTRIMMPIYCRVAGKVIAVSDITRDVFVEKLGVSPAKIKRVYFAPGIQFQRRYSAEERERLVRECEDSGLSRRDFCEKQAINQTTFHGWSKGGKSNGRTKGFVRTGLTATGAAPIDIVLPLE